MSSKNNVNPDHYKIAGRDKPNKTVANTVARRGKSSGVSIQTSNKSGVSSTSRKQASSRSYLQRDPASGPVAGAFGKSGSLSEIEEEMTHPEKDADIQDDFIAERRRQNKKAKK
jgi:hypothetical protein